MTRKPVAHSFVGSDMGPTFYHPPVTTGVIGGGFASPAQRAWRVAAYVHDHTLHYQYVVGRPA